MFKKIALISIAVLLLTACSSKESDGKHIRIASHTEPMTTVIEIATKELEEKGYTVELVSVADNSAGNTALQNKEIDANFFQHVPFMEAFNKAHSANLVGVTPIYDAIIAFYGKDIKSEGEITEGMKVAIPNDVDNQARALLILQDYDLIELADGGSYSSTISDITDNRMNFEFYEVDLLTLTQAYEDVDFVFNYPTYAGKIGLFPNVDGILIENSTNHYAISLVAREDNKDSQKIKDLQEAMTSDAVREFLLNDENARTLVPSF